MCLSQVLCPFPPPASGSSLLSGLPSPSHFCKFISLQLCRHPGVSLFLPFAPHPSPCLHTLSPFLSPCLSSHFCLLVSGCLSLSLLSSCLSPSASAASPSLPFPDHSAYLSGLTSLLSTSISHPDSLYGSVGLSVHVHAPLPSTPTHLQQGAPPKSALEPSVPELRPLGREARPAPWSSWLSAQHWTTGWRNPQPTSSAPLLLPLRDFGGFPPRPLPFPFLCCPGWSILSHSRSLWGI